MESRLHHCLDITLREDESRVRTPTAARILGTIRCIVRSFANAAVNRARKNNPKSKCNTGTFQSRFKSAHGGRERLHALIHAKLPSVLDLGNRKDASYQSANIKEKNLHRFGGLVTTTPN